MNSRKNPKILVHGDESYFLLSDANKPCNEGYYTSNNYRTQTEAKCFSKNKCEPKFMVWAAISVDQLNIDVYRKLMRQTPSKVRLAASDGLLSVE